MRSLRPVLVALIASTVSMACDDGFQEAFDGEIEVLNVAANSPVSAVSRVDFAGVRVGDPADVHAFAIRNTAGPDGGDLLIRDITFSSPSPYISAVLSNNPPSCATDPCSFGEFTLTPLESVQLDLAYEPQTVDAGCGDPPEGKDDGWCGQVIISSNDRVQSEITLDFYVTALGGDLRVCLEDGSCSNNESLIMAFNPAVVGDLPQTKRFEIDNIGSNILTIENVTSTFNPNTDFSMVATNGEAPPFFINPNDPPVEFQVTFEPQQDVMDRSGNIFVSSDGGNLANASIAVQIGNPNAAQIEVTPNPYELRFVNINPPDSDTQEITITNTGGATAAALLVSVDLDQTASGDYSAFNSSGEIIAGGQCDGGSPPTSCSDQIIIARGASEVLSVTYAPQSGTPSNAIFTIDSNDPDPADATIAYSLIGSGGTGAIITDVPTITWDDPAIMASSDMSFTATNEGDVDVIISDIMLANFVPMGAESDFVLSHDNLPITLAPSAASTITLTYTQPDETPKLNRTGNVVLTHNGIGGSTTVTASVNNP